MRYMEQSPRLNSKIEAGGKEESKLVAVKGMPESFHASPEIKSIIGKYYKTSKPDKIVLEVERKDGNVRVFTLKLPQDIIAIPSPLLREIFPRFNENGIDVMYSLVGDAIKKEFSLP